MLFSELYSKLKKGEIGSLYLLTGEEPLLLVKAQNLFKEVILAEGSESFDLDILDAGGLSNEMFYGALRSLPMLSSRRLVIIRDINRFSSPLQKNFTSALREKLEKVTIVLTADQADYRKSLFKELRGKAVQIELSSPDDKELRKILKICFPKKEIDESVFNFIAKAGVNISEAFSWLEQAVNYLEDSDELNLETLKLFVDLSGTAQMMSFTNAVAAKDRKSAVICLEDMMRYREKSGSISWQLKELYILLNLFLRIKAKGGRPIQYRKSIKIRNELFDQINSHTQYHNLESVIDGLKRIQTMDSSLKSSGLDSKALFIELVNSITAR